MKFILLYIKYLKVECEGFVDEEDEDTSWYVILEKISEKNVKSLKSHEIDSLVCKKV